MKKTQILALFLTIMLFSCKDGNDPGNPSSFMNMNAGSVWNYETTNNVAPGGTTSYTRTSTSRDTVANGNTYHVFTNSGTNASDYFRVSGSDYYTFQKLPAELGGSQVENLYLKTNVAVGISWSQSSNVTVPGFPIPLNVTLTNSITEKGITKTINAVTYNGVIHTKTTIAVSGIPASAITTDINNYYAPEVGMIESTNKIAINYLSIMSSTDNTIRLKSSVLK